MTGWLRVVEMRWRRIDFDFWNQPTWTSEIYLDRIKPECFFFV